MYILQSRMSEIIDFLEYTIRSWKFMQLAIFAYRFVYTVLTDLQSRFCWKLIYIYVLWRCMSEVIDFFKNAIGSCKFRQHAIFWQIYLCALFWLIYHIHHVNNCIQLSTLRWATISNTVMCTLHDFGSSKVWFIHTSTVTRLHSCYGKKYTYGSRTSC